MIPKDMIEAATNAYCKWLNGMPEGTPAALREGMEAALTAALSSAVPKEIGKLIERLHKPQLGDDCRTEAAAALERLARANEHRRVLMCEYNAVIAELEAERDALMAAAKALDRLLIVAGERTSRGRAIDMLPLGTLRNAREALAALRAAGIKTEDTP